MNLKKAICIAMAACSFPRTLKRRRQAALFSHKKAAPFGAALAIYSLVAIGSPVLYLVQMRMSVYISSRSGVR